LTLTATKGRQKGQRYKNKRNLHNDVGI